MCDHTDNGVLAFEIRHDQGKTPTYICRVCKEEFNQSEASAIIEGLL